MAVLMTRLKLMKGFHKCRTCGKTKHLKDFIASADVKWMPGNCRACEGERNRKRKGSQKLEVVYEKPAACEVCGEGGQICYDHCHETDTFRGWLCQRCNTILGFAKDDVERLRKLADYLDECHKK